MTLLTRKGDLWVFNKPSGMLVHPARHDARDPLPDLMAWAREYEGAPDDIAPCHRLDLETSGLVLASPDPAIRAAIGAMFAAGEVTKKYKALTFGRARRKGIIRKRLHDGRRRALVDAVTRYRLEAWLGPFSLLTVRPETGRKHQIRRHLESIGHSVVGDERYPPRRFRKVPGFPGRLWLHANELTLPDGRRFRAPLADELEAHLRLLLEMNGEPLDIFEGSADEDPEFEGLPPGIPVVDQIGPDSEE